MHVAPFAERGRMKYTIRAESIGAPILMPSNEQALVGQDQMYIYAYRLLVHPGWLWAAWLAH